MKLEEYLRPQFYNHIRPLFIENECDICGAEENLELHHVKQFSELLKETLEDLGLQYYDTIDAYTPEQISNINNIMLGK